MEKSRINGLSIILLVLGIVIGLVVANIMVSSSKSLASEFGDKDLFEIPIGTGIVVRNSETLPSSGAHLKLSFLEVVYGESDDNGDDNDNNGDNGDDNDDNGDDNGDESTRVVQEVIFSVYNSLTGEITEHSIFPTSADLTVRMNEVTGYDSFRGMSFVGVRDDRTQKPTSKNTTGALFIVRLADLDDTEDSIPETPADSAPGVEQPSEETPGAGVGAPAAPETGGAGVGAPAAPYTGGAAPETGGAAPAI